MSLLLRHADEIRKCVLVIYSSNSFSYSLNIKFLSILKGSACGLWAVGASVSAVSSSACSEGNMGWGQEGVSLEGLGPGAFVKSIDLEGRDGSDGGDEGEEFHFC